MVQQQVFMNKMFHKNSELLDALNNYHVFKKNFTMELVGFGISIVKPINSFTRAS
jgi:hypothetical protein